MVRQSQARPVSGAGDPLSKERRGCTTNHSAKRNILLNIYPQSIRLRESEDKRKFTQSKKAFSLRRKSPAEVKIVNVYYEVVTQSGDGVSSQQINQQQVHTKRP